MTLIGLPEEQGVPGKASKSDSYAIDKMSIRVSPKVFGARIRWVMSLVSHLRHKMDVAFCKPC